MNPPTTPPANSEAVQAALNWNSPKSFVEQVSILGTELKLLQAALAEKEAVSVARAEQDMRSYWQAVSDGADWQMRAEKAEAALAAANKRISDLEAITPDEALKVFLESSEQLRREAEQERDRYMTVLEDQRRDILLVARLRRYRDRQDAANEAARRIEAALATPGDGANKSVDGPSGRLLVACLEEGYDVKKTSRGFEAMKT